MQLVVVSLVLLIVLISLSSSDSNTTGEYCRSIKEFNQQRLSVRFEDSSIVPCDICSPCWNIFSKNYGPCSIEKHDWKLFNDGQSICIDTLILLLIMFISIVAFIPTCLWLFHLCIQRCRNIDAKYIVNEGIIS
jgi:hypothetical protein